MKKFQFARYIKKFYWLIILFSALACFFFIYFAKNMQTYTANAVICYSNYDAKSGKTPDGKEIDLTQIYSSKVLSKVFEELELDYSKVDFDDLRSRFYVDPIYTTEQVAMQEAANKNGTAYEEKATEYRVSFVADSTEGQEFAQEILDTTLEKYIAYYNETHSDQAFIANPISSLYDSDYDYIEMTEIIKSTIENAKEFLAGKFDADNGFRSVKTGYTFYDLYCEFEFLGDTYLSDLFSNIINNKISKNKDVLVSKYKQRISDYDLNNITSTSEIENVQGVIESYVEKMQSSGNTDITHEYILDNVYNTYNENQGWSETDRTVEYDVLLEQYASDRKSYEHNIIDAAYCQYIIDAFSDTVTEENVSDEGSEESAEEQPIEAFFAYSESSVKDDIQALVEKMEDLYKIANETNAEFNEQIGANNIAVLATTDVAKGVNLELYYVIAFILFFLIGTVGSVLFGRYLDYSEYKAYVDPDAGITNKNGCKRYINENKRKFLSSNYICMAVKASVPFSSMEVKDSSWLANTMGRLLSGMFDNVDNVFYCYYEADTFVLFGQGLTYETGVYYESALRNLVKEYNEATGSEISIDCIIKDSSRDHIFSINELLNKTMAFL